MSRVGAPEPFGFISPPFKMRTVTEMEKFRYRTWDTKEPETIAWIQSFSPRDVFFDVGACIGIYSLYAASLFPQMYIIAFEPMPANTTAIRLNREMNGFVNIKILDVAVGNTSQSVLLDIPDREAGKSGAQISDTGIIVPGTRLEFFLGYPSKSINVKIDIDGQEANVVRGMMRLLPSVKSILIEVSLKSKQDIVDILVSRGFTTDNRFNTMTPHSRERREKEGIDAENIVFVRQ